MILETGKMQFPMKCQNPFVTAMYHLDRFPKGDGKLGPAVRKSDRPDRETDPDAPWQMYYGEKVPGFPAHPHRGFETITVVLQGTIDHTDGLGSQGRYEDGDVQWMTAGSGIQHAEMFPLRHTDRENPLELFQIWLSLDRKHRMAKPAYRMLWREDIPLITIKDGAGLSVKLTVFAGEANGRKAPAPTPDSWAADPGHRLSIQLIEMEPGSAYTVPPGTASQNRSLYFYAGETLAVEGKELHSPGYAFVTAEAGTPLRNTGKSPAKVLLLEAEPIPEPIVAHGPFVMSSEEEIRQSYMDYRLTEFGGWPFDSAEAYHSADRERFARYADGTVEYPAKKQA